MPKKASFHAIIPWVHQRRAGCNSTPPDSPCASVPGRIWLKKMVRYTAEVSVVLPEQRRVLPPDPPSPDIPTGSDEHNTPGADQCNGDEREAGVCGCRGRDSISLHDSLPVGDRDFCRTPRRQQSRKCRAGNYPGRVGENSGNKKIWDPARCDQKKSREDLPEKFSGIFPEKFPARPGLTNSFRRPPDPVAAIPGRTCSKD